jgi:hypothetical protein
MGRQEWIWKRKTVSSEIIVLITTVLFSEIDGDWMKKKKK